MGWWGKFQCQGSRTLILQGVESKTTHTVELSSSASFVLRITLIVLERGGQTVAVVIARNADG